MTIPQVKRVRLEFPPRSLRTGESGFSLVEVITAAAILGVAVSALTIMIGNSDVMELESDHFRQARIIAQHELEDPWSHFLNYDKPHESEDMLLDLNDPDRVALPARDDVSKTVDQEADFGDGVKIPYRTIQARVSWTEKSGQALSLTLSKRITNVQ
jgi:prepilin-type N-terminal cleavage/methylation domain-containing protein